LRPWSSGRFVERLDEGTHFNHVIEHAAAELLALAGFTSRDKRICNGDERDDSKAVIETTMVETARFLMPAAAGLVENIVENATDFNRKNNHRAKHVAFDTELGPSGRTIVEAAERRGIPWSREDDYSLVQLGYGKNLHYVQRR
jgi:cyanophycin synthetase